jgi:hypothetical protein
MALQVYSPTKSLWNIKEFWRDEEDSPQKLLEGKGGGTRMDDMTVRGEGGE